MLFSEFISRLRNTVGDLETLTQDKWNGDGATVAFQTSERPILDSSYDVYISDVLKTETTHYTLNKDTGLLDFTAGGAPASGTKNLKMNYKYIFLRDDEWITIINNVLSRWRRKIWTQAIDESTFDSVEDADDYDMATISSNLIWVVGAFFKKSTDVEWTAINRDHKVIYNPELNKLNVRPAFSSSDYDFRIVYLKAYTLGSAVGSTFEPAEKYHSAIELACQAEYWQRVANYKLKDVKAIVKEQGYSPASQIMNQALNLRKLADIELGKVKPILPPMNVATAFEGIKT